MVGMVSIGKFGLCEVRQSRYVKVRLGTERLVPFRQSRFVGAWYAWAK